MAKNLYRMVLSMAAGLLLALVTLGGSDSVSAVNLKGPANHIVSIHYADEETWCTDVHFSTYSLASALTVIDAAYTGNPPADWHGVASGKVDLSDALFGQCFDDPSWQSNYRLINQVVSNFWSDVYCGGTSCQYTLYNYSCPGGICHYGNSHQMLRQSIMESYPIQIHVVNHETGHAFGFDDPPYSEDCAITSVMHSAYYGCVDYYFPTQNDRDVLTYFVQDETY